MIFRKVIGAATLGLSLLASAAFAEEVSVKAVMAPQEQMKFDLNDGTKHFVLAVHRQGKAEGEGPLAGANVDEYGWHDINPPMAGDPRGYLRFETAGGDVAIVKFTVRAVFMKGEGKPALHDNGFWELTSGTGIFAGKRGVGALAIHPAGGPNREFTLTGVIDDAP
ncbi:hypothetical protein [Roseovarius sp.]|uniref:hypothetical protein n=1 Tax=Roseovarius sp. TaxID=1486281 RepID=UPI0025EB4927|nr:hypothetical protein [Roseovarius sp.]